MAKRWSELSERQQTTILVAASVQLSLELSLAATAWADLATRPAELVHGRKAVWALIIGVNFVGPIAYFARGRLPQERRDI
jgi:Phospholipase_D-nuclease N-terminal